MAASPAVRKARRSLIALVVIIAALVGLIAIGVARGEATWTPKLALDLQGGTQILLAPKQSDGTQVSGEQLNQAVAIIRQRVDASGVSEAEITTQGSQNIVVSIPGKADETTLARIEASAKMDFRPVLSVTNATFESAATPEGDATENESVAGSDDPVDGEVAEPEVADEAVADDVGESSEGETDGEEEGELYPDPLPEAASDLAWLTPKLLAEFEAFNCDSEEALRTGEAPSDRPLITCDVSGSAKYILGPVELGGEVISDAQAQAEVTSTGATTGGWAIQITMNDDGTRKFGEISNRTYGAQPPLNQFSFVLDGQVLLAPTMQAQILDGRPSITGSYTQESAKLLADQLKFGALPIGFEVQSQEDISATLGTNQLEAGLLAGLVGLLLIVVYSIFQYRVLGSITIASLAVAAVVTYLLLTFMSWREGYRLSLAGVAGVIVAIGFTADSFIVYFERIRDELRDGRSVEKSVDAGWKRALRTILASDGIMFLGSVILFVLAVGNVRGFAFTLGLTTIVDVLVVMLFTHPMLVLLARTNFYQSGHKFSGLDPRQLGAVYRGRARFQEPVVNSRGAAAKKVRGAQREAQRRQTIAERKRAEADQLTSTTQSEGEGR